MGSSIIVIAILISAITFGVVIEKRNKEKRCLRYIKTQFGEKPIKRTLDFALTKLFFEEQQDGKAGVDDETWDDLDMNDVFDRLNATFSFAGEQYLYKTLREPFYYRERAKGREKKIKFLKMDERNRVQIQLALLRIGKQPSSYYLPSFFRNMDAFRINHIWVYRILQGLFIAALLLSILLHSTAVIVMTSVLFLMNLCIYALAKNKYEVNLEVVSGMYRVLQAIQECMRKDSAFGSNFPELEAAILPVKKSLRYFKLILGRNGNVSRDMQEIVATYLTGAFLFDFTMYEKLLLFMIKEQKHFQKIFELAGELDMLQAILSFRQSIPHYCSPEVHVELTVDMEELYHPLIERPVCNSVRLGKHTIITGSNASGKSTFMKAVAINQIFAQSIHTCTAQKYSLPISGVVTSMAVRDQIMEGESYYMREIKSLKRAFTSTRGSEPVLCAVDEILRGTNALERLAASAAVIRYMQQQNSILIIATHDLELLTLLEQEAFAYFYFSEQQGEDDVIFDYQIRSGVSRETNAIKLLKKVDFPTEIIEDAVRIYKTLGD